jgi:type VI secretion system protein ImpF
MAELAPKERLQPSLLDRLTDDEPDKAVESREQRVLSMRRLRECVVRDLAFLFNAGNLAQGQAMEAVRRREQGGEALLIDEVPLVAHTTINYGLPDLAGKTASSLDIHTLESLLRQAIRDFEPRLLHHTISVQAVPATEQLQRHNKLVFMIQGQLWGQRLPDNLFLRTEIDLEIGEVRVFEQS